MVAANGILALIDDPHHRINEDGTWQAENINNSDWTSRIDAAVKAHLAGQADETVTATPAARPAHTRTMPTDPDAFAEWLTRAMDSEDGI